MFACICFWKEFVLIYVVVENSMKWVSNLKMNIKRLDFFSMMVVGKIVKKWSIIGKDKWGRRSREINGKKTTIPLHV